MSAYSYRALTSEGKITKGVMEGDSERQVRSQLRTRSLRPLQVRAARSGQMLAPGGNRLWRPTRLKPADLSLFTRQLATLIQSGLPLSDALQACARQSRKTGVQELILQIRSRVQEGHSLAWALGETPRNFDDLYRSTIHAGESSGYLGAVLMRLADYCENGQHARQKLRMAMIYPFILVAVAVTVIAVLMTFVMPKLITIFAHSDKELPGLTQALIGISHFLSTWGLHCLAGVALVVIAWQWWLRALSNGKPHNRLRWHRILLRLPIVGGWQRSLDSSRFAATLSILMSSGVPLLEALRIAQQVMSNLALRQACESVVTAVSEGTSLHSAMEKADVFPPMLVQMVACGELSGDVDKLLARAAENQERELMHATTTLLTVMEPLLVVVMGGIVALIVLAVLLPIFDLNTLVK